MEAKRSLSVRKHILLSLCFLFAVAPVLYCVYSRVTATDTFESDLLCFGSTFLTSPAGAVASLWITGFRTPHLVCLIGICGIPFGQFLIPFGYMESEAFLRAESKMDQLALLVERSGEFEQPVWVGPYRVIDGWVADDGVVLCTSHTTKGTVGFMKTVEDRGSEFVLGMSTYTRVSGNWYRIYDT